MNPDHPTGDPLLSKARSALDRGAPPSAATLTALRAAAVRHAARSPWRRFWSNPRHGAAALLGGLAAAAVLAILLTPHEPRPAAGSPAETAQADTDWALFDTNAEDALALLSLLAAGQDASQAQALLSFQEQPGAFEDAYALSAHF